MNSGDENATFTQCIYELNIYLCFFLQLWKKVSTHFDTTFGFQKSEFSYLILFSHIQIYWRARINEVCVPNLFSAFFFLYGDVA